MTKSEAHDSPKVLGRSQRGERCVAAVAERHHGAWADNGYKNKAVEHAATCGIDLEVVRRNSNAPAPAAVVRDR